MYLSAFIVYYFPIHTGTHLKCINRSKMHQFAKYVLTNFERPQGRFTLEAEAANINRIELQK